MRNITILLVLLFAYNGYSQIELMDSIETFRFGQSPDLAKSFCTNGYWYAERDGGISTFKQIWRWGEEIQLKAIKEQANGNRAVLTVNLMMMGKPVDQIYLYLKKESGNWFIDGIDENKRKIDHFLDGRFSGHFTPMELPHDPDLKKLGDLIVSFGQDEEVIISFLEQNFAAGSDFDFTGQLVNPEFEPHFCHSAGYDKVLNKGYIHLMAARKGDEEYFSNITLYITKTDEGIFKIIERLYGTPSSNDFF